MERNFEHASFDALVRQRAESEPDTLVFTFLEGGEREEAKLTYRDLHHRAQAIAGWLQQFGQPGDPVVLSYPGGADFICAFLGCAYAGMPAVPTPTPAGHQKGRAVPWLEYIITDARPAVMLAPAPVRELLRPHADTKGGDVRIAGTLVHELPRDFASWAAAFRPVDNRGDSVLHLQYTSGTTTAPRGTQITHRNVLVNCGMMQRSWDFRADSVDMVWVPNHHDDGLVHGLLCPIYNGHHAVVMQPNDLLLKPAAWLRAITRYRATHTGGPNFLYNYAAKRVRPEEREGLDLSSLRVAYCGAEPIRKETLERYAVVKVVA